MPSVVSVAPMPAMGCDGAFSVLVRSRQAKHDAHEESKEGGSLLTNTILLFVDADGLRLSVVVLAQTASLVPTHVLSAQQRFSTAFGMGPHGLRWARCGICPPSSFSCRRCSPPASKTFAHACFLIQSFYPWFILLFWRNVGGELEANVCSRNAFLNYTWLAK